MNSVINLKENWNAFDSAIYSMEEKVGRLVKRMRESREPNLEIMIAAETKHLKTENEKLKALQFPKKIIKSDGKQNYTCPNKKCGIEISSVLIEQYKIKFCPECGQRIYYVPIKEKMQNL